jgi:acetoin:2,6-dichlorophenolindophenol oxidoreductase subunit beta
MSSKAMRRITYAQAFVEGLDYAMSKLPNLSLIGNEVLGLGPHRVHLEKIWKKYPERVNFPPTSEGAFAALAAGAAMSGERVFCHLGAASFSFLAMTAIANEAASAHYASGGKLKVPVVYHMLHGLRVGGGTQHSMSPQAMYWNVPGLQVVLPASPCDAKGLVAWACASDNPSVMFTHDLLIGLEGEVPEEGYEIPFGQAEVKRKGRDATVVATSHSVQLALQAAAALSKDGIEVEVVDPRTLVPLDKATILGSVRKTGRLVVADETHRSCGVASEIAAIAAEEAFASLKAPVLRVSRPDVPTPFSRPLEDAITPTAEMIVAAVRQVMAS